ncbi:hypothetical protein GGI07_001216 [Coemansia sp. Benny D115]|nr:hypothetical protein GGI07_001216 [Coemansia sp. Benny D115]
MSDSRSSAYSTTPSVESLLSTSDLDVLFRNCRLSLRIPQDTTRQSATIPLPSDNWSVQQIASSLPTRPFLYHGEKVQGYLVATIPNVEQLRRTLAILMDRMESDGSSRGQLVLKDEETRYFYSKLRFHIVAYQAKLLKPIGSDPAAGPRIRGVSSTASYSHSITYTPDKAQIDMLEGGSLCCVYPFTITVPGPADSIVWPVESAIMFEIRAACQDTHRDKELSSAELRVNDRSELLEELALRVSSDIFAHSSGPRQERSIVADADSLPVLPRRIFQALVPTTPIVDISTRIVALPPSFGTDAALIEVSVQYSGSASSIVGKDLSLDSVSVQSSEWHVQDIGGAGLPLAMAEGVCWQNIFKISPLAKDVKEEALEGLRLLNVNGGGALNHDKNIDDHLLVLATVRATGGPSESESPLVFGVSHYFKPTPEEQQQQPQQPYNQALQVPGANAEPADTADAYASESRSMSVAATVLSARSNNSLEILGHEPPPPLPIVKSHLKTTSLDYSANSSHKQNTLLHARNQSLAVGSHSVYGDSLKTAEGQSSFKRPTGMLRVPPPHADKHEAVIGNHPLTSPINNRYTAQILHERAMLSYQRSRAATINALSIAPRPSISYPRASVSATRKSTMASLTAKHNQNQNQQQPQQQQQRLPGRGSLSLSEASETERRVSLMRRRPSYTPSFSSLPPQAQGPGTQIGTLQLSFEAPPKVALGEELTVRVYISNNTNVRYFRLCLVDVFANTSDSEEGDDKMEEGAVLSPTRGLASLNHATDVPPLRPGESTFVALQYIAAAPYFHTIRLLRLLDLDSDTADKALVTIEAPFVVYIDDGRAQ